MAETVRIEIPIETIDNTDPELSKIIRGFERMENAADGANRSAKKAGTTVTRFDRQAQKTEKSLLKWAKQKYKILLEAKDKIAPVISALGSRLKNFAGRTWRVTMRAFDFVTAPVRGIINLLKNPIFQVGAVLGISIGLKDTIETYKNFEAAMSKVKAISGATSSEFKKLTAKAEEMGRVTKFTATESAEALNYMAMAGWKTEDMLNGIEGIMYLAGASGEDLATTSDIVTDAITAFGMKAGDASHFADVLAVASSNANTNVSMMGETFKYVGAASGALGYSVDDVALAIGLMANSGIKASQAGIELNSIFTRLATNTNGAKDAIEDLGVGFFTSDGNARSFLSVLKDLRTATANMNKEDKMNIANKIAGTRAQAGLLAMLNATAEDFNKVEEAIRNADGAAMDMYDTMQDNLQGSLDSLNSKMESVKLSFGKRLSPYIKQFAEWLGNQMPAINQTLDEFMDWTDKRVDRIKRKFDEITDTKEWQDADLFGKARIVWDDFIAEPFFEWWNTTGKAKFAGFSQNIGKGIGTGLKYGIMTLLGIDIGETVDEGASIGASFAKGFSEGFDFDTVSKGLLQGIKNMASNALKLLPGGESAGFSSVFSAIMLSKIMSPLFGLGRGTFSLGRALFGSSGGVSLMGPLIGSTGNAMVGGSGLLGTMANVGYALNPGNTAGLYFGSTAGTMSGGVAALSGAGAIAGGVIGGAALISSGIDAYKAIKSDDKEEKNAYAASAGLKAGGVAAGAAIGTLILPGVGTLIGAGIGGLSGWIAGNKVKENYQKNVEEMQKQAEHIRNVYEATGLSIDKVRFANEDLNEAFADTELSAQELATMIQEDMTKVGKEAFGDISLSLTEIKTLSESITFGDMADGMETFLEAGKTAQSSLATLKSAVQTMNKQNWKVSLGMVLDETERDDYKSAIDDFVNAANTYIQDSHYQATVALGSLTNGTVGTEGLDSAYADIQAQVDELSAKLYDTLTNALLDNVIDPFEAEALTEIQKTISETTGRLADAQSEASLDVLSIKYSGNGAGLDFESFTSLQEELKAQSDSFRQTLEEELTISITNLRLQFPDGGTEFEQKLQELKDNYVARINEEDVRVRSFNIDTIASAWETQLGGILPELEGTLSEKLTTAMNNALIINPDAGSWTQDEVMEWFDLGGIDTSRFEDIFRQLKATAEMIPQETKETILQGFKDSVPTAEEIKAAIDWDYMTGNDWAVLMESITGTEGASFGLSAEDAAKPMKEYYGEYFEKIKQSYSEALHNALQDSDNETLGSFMEQYMTDAAGGFDFKNVMSQYGPVSNEYYPELITEWQTAGENLGMSLNTGTSKSLRDGSSLLRTELQTALSTATASPFTISPTVNVTPNYNITSPKFPAFNQSVSGNAAGGYVSGGPQLSWLAEEGYGEFVIPTNPSRRSRALDLYEQAGVALGVSAHAAGGYVGGSILSDTVADYKLFTDANKNVPITCNKTTEGNYGGETAQTYEAVSAEMDVGLGSTPIQINVSVAPEFVIHGSEGQSEDDIMQVIRRHMKEMADELGGEIAEKLEEVFSNMPAKEA